MSRKNLPEPYLALLGSHLRSLRKNIGLSQEDVADKAGIHVTYLSGIERGFRNPTVLNLRRLANALGVSIRDLFSFDQPL